ncbi:hypothetical protein [Klebsiella michiganensis]|uniref:hypothetical protein n=1 Tax=Klebsiella michiganensis TaxID=1134687 RepID=UPI003D98E7B7
MNDKTSEEENEHAKHVNSNDERSLMGTTITIPGVGRLYHYGTNNLSVDYAAREIGAAYARRQSNINNMSRSRMNISGVMDILGILSSSLDLASSGLSIPVNHPQRVAIRIIFKNDADIILIPGQINLPNQSGTYTSTMPLFPGESCTVLFINRNALVSSRVSFSFGAISTDSRFLPLNTTNPDVFPFEIWIGRNNGKIHMQRVHGFAGGSHIVHEVLTPASFGQTNNLQYVGFQGGGTTTMPSFGIACVQANMNENEGNEMTIKITFTPLDLRS